MIIFCDQLGFAESWFVFVRRFIQVIHRLHTSFTTSMLFKTSTWWILSWKRLKDRVFTLTLFTLLMEMKRCYWYCKRNHPPTLPASYTFLLKCRACTSWQWSCFSGQVTDDMNSIGRSISSALPAFYWWRCRVSLSSLREAGSLSRGYEGSAASGVVPVVKETPRRQLLLLKPAGQRQGAGVCLPQCLPSRYYCFPFY